MKTLPLLAAKARLSPLVDQVSKTDAEVVITELGIPLAVLISARKYEGWQETTAILSDAAFMREIKAGLKALKSGRAKSLTLDELFQEGRRSTPSIRSIAFGPGPTPQVERHPEAGFARGSPLE